MVIHTSSEQRVCDTGNLGVCIAGTQTCDQSGYWGSCVQNISQSEEVCDGVDNDCDGIVDENVCAPANGWTYEQKFNTLADGDLNGQDSWSGSTIFDVTTNAAAIYEGAKGVKVIAGVAQRYIVSSIDAATEGIMYIAIKPVTIASGERIEFFLMETGFQKTSIKFDESSGDIQINHNGVYSSIYDTYSLNQWYVIALEIDAGNNQYQAKVHNGTSWNSFSGMDDAADGGTFVEINEIRLQLRAGGTVYWDTITGTDPTQ